MAKTTEVKVKLKVEDGGSSSVLDRIKKGFFGVESAEKLAEKSAKDFAEQFVEQNKIKERIDKVKDSFLDLSRSIAVSAIEGQKADKSIAGLIAIAQGSQWSAAYESAQALNDQLDEISVKAGQAGDDVGAAFQVMAEISGATEGGLAKAKEQTASLATIANTLGKSTADIAREFSFMGEGVVKTKGQLFQLLQTTGIFGDKTKDASNYWASLTEESRLEQLSSGLEKVASKLKDSEPVIGDYLTTIDNLFGMAKEKLGEPIINSMKPALTDLIGRLKVAMPAIEKFGIVMGKEISHWVDDAVKEISEGFKYMETHAEEIKNAIAEGYKTAKEVVMFILDHKEEIAIAFGANAVLPGLRAGASAAGSLIDASAKGIGPLAGTGGGIAAGAATMVAFAAAVGAFALVVDQWGELMASTEGGKSEGQQDFAAYQRSFEQRAAAPDTGAWGKDEMKGFEQQRAAFVQLAQDLGENARAAGELADRAFAAHKGMRDMVGPVEEAQKMFDNFAKARAEGMIPDEASIATADSLIGQVGASFTKAMATHNQGASQYIANLLAKSEGLQGAFLASADLTSEGFEALASMVEGQSKEFADLLRGRAGEGKTAPATPAAPKVVMTGGQTFQIKQDFRDQDPDRVAIMFERDIGRSIERKLSAGSNVFGA